MDDAHRVLGTPNEESWPGVKQLPDYKPTFPQWSSQDLAEQVPYLDAAGIDLLKVNEYHLLLVIVADSRYSKRWFMIAPYASPRNVLFCIHISPITEDRFAFLMSRSPLPFVVHRRSLSCNLFP